LIENVEEILCESDLEEDAAGRDRSCTGGDEGTHSRHKNKWIKMK
jgi:hypothetical protein